MTAIVMGYDWIVLALPVLIFAGIVSLGIKLSRRHR
jgi:hypothetical protein